MPNDYVAVLFAKVLGNLFDDEYRTVIAPGTPDRHGEILPVGILESRNPVIEKMDDIRKELLHDLVFFQVADNSGIAAREWAQRWLPIGVGQAAGIEHEVGITGQAVPEAE